MQQNWDQWGKVVQGALFGRRLEQREERVEVGMGRTCMENKKGG